MLLQILKCYKIKNWIYDINIHTYIYICIIWKLNEFIKLNIKALIVYIIDIKWKVNYHMKMKNVLKNTCALCLDIKM